jgi:nucleoid-associated protein EbfC
MNPFDASNLGAMLGNFQQRMDEMKKRAESTVVEGTAAGGLVRVKVTCAYECTEVSIDPTAAEDPEMLEDLIRAATNEALRQARETTAQNMGELAQGLPIPPGLLGM